MKREKKSCANCAHSVDMKLDSRLLVCAHPQKVKKNHILFGSKDFKCSKWEAKREYET